MWLSFTKVDQAIICLSNRPCVMNPCTKWYKLCRVQSASACMCTQNSTDLSDGQGRLPLFPIPRLEAIAATQLTRRRFLTDFWIHQELIWEWFSSRRLIRHFKIRCCHSYGMWAQWIITQSSPFRWGQMNLEGSNLRSGVFFFCFGKKGKKYAWYIYLTSR